MITSILRELKPALLLFFWLTLLTGAVYPLGVTGLGGLLFPAQAQGSLLPGKELPAGVALIGQPFASERYFWSRPSATSPHEYNAAASSGSNLAPSNPALAEAVAGRIARLTKAHGPGPVPMDLVTSSGSGLDPHISVRGAAYQLDRVAKARGLAPSELAALAERHTQRPLLGFWGEARVNVLSLNLALDVLRGKE
jgi:K+-transporting ATPase ATPase C chain